MCDQLGNGTEIPSYKYAGELSDKYTDQPGVVDMANAGSNRNGSQFFIGSGAGEAGLAPKPACSVFGQVESGMDVVEIAGVTVGANSRGEQSVPLEPVYMRWVEKLEN